MTDEQDLTDRLADAAAGSVQDGRAAILDGAGNLAGVTVEVELSNGGDVFDVTSYLSWHSVIRSAKRGEQ